MRNIFGSRCSHACFRRSDPGLPPIRSPEDPLYFDTETHLLSPISGNLFFGHPSSARALDATGPRVLSTRRSAFNSFNFAPPHTLQPDATKCQCRTFGSFTKAPLALEAQFVCHRGVAQDAGEVGFTKPRRSIPLLCLRLVCGCCRPDDTAPSDIVGWHGGRVTDRRRSRFQARLDLPTIRAACLIPLPSVSSTLTFSTLVVGRGGRLNFTSRLRAATYPRRLRWRRPWRRW